MRLLFFALLFLSVPVLAQRPFVRDYWLNESNMPAKVNALQQDATGYIWLGTDAGLYRFNGSDFEIVSDNEHKSVTAVSISGNNIWVGFANGKIGLVVQSAIKILPVKNGPASAITSIQAYNNNVLLISTEEEGMFCIFNNVSTAINMGNGLSDNFVYTLSVHGNNRIIAGTDKGINDITIQGNKYLIHPFTTAQGLPDNIIRVIKDIPHTMWSWVGTQEGGLVLYNKKNGAIKVPQSGTSWAWGQVNDILPLSATHAWVATEEGYLLDVVLKDSFQIDVQPYYYAGKKFRKLLRDQSGNIWCATTQGLTLLTAEYLTQIRLSAPYSLHDITAMVWDKGILWLALKNELCYVSLKDADPQLVPVFTSQTIITSLYVDKANRLWIGTWGNGLYCRGAHTAAANIHNIAPLINESILNITGTDTSLWIAGLNGVEELSYNENAPVQLIRHHDKKSGIGSDYVYQLYKDHKGRIWMATDGAGVCMYDGRQYHHWKSFSPSNKQVAYTITEDIYGDIWAGTLYKDLFRFHNNRWENTRIPETQNADINISTVMANASGQVISVFQKCIDEWYPKSGYFRHFNKRLGIGVDSTSNVLNCAAKDEAGNVYLPFEHGILIFKNQQSNYDIRPVVHVKETRINLKPISPNRHKLDYDENYISFYFEGINFTNPERLNFRYMLQGYNNEWINTNDASVTFPKLPPGKYAFRIQTSLNTSFDHAKEEAYTFSIAAPIWRTPWFYTLLIVVCFVIGYLYIKLREKRLKKVSLLQQERMLFEYEHLKSQVNPHFLFNSLNTLTSLIEENKDAAVDYTIQLSDLYRNMLAYRNKDLILLSEEYGILSSYIHIQQSRFGSALSIETSIPDEVMQSKKIVPLALQLLVENAIKHNVVSISRPLIIYIIANDKEITVRNYIAPKMSKEKGAGLGLVNIKNRYGLLTQRQIVYGVQKNEYIVILPLL